MTSVYEDKIYPEISWSPTDDDDRLAAQHEQQDQAQFCRLKKINEAEKCLRGEVL